MGKASNDYIATAASDLFALTRQSAPVQSDFDVHLPHAIFEQTDGLVK